MTYLLLLCLMLTVMSYFSATEHSFHREYIFQYHDFSTPFFFLGIEHSDQECEEQRVTCLRIGFVLFQVQILTYKHNEATLQQYPWLRGAGICRWQKWVQSFCYTLDLPLYRNSNDME